MNYIDDQQLCYLGTPYTNFPGGIDKAFHQASRIAAHLSLAGLTIFCPIAHGHALGRAAGLDPKNPAVFERINKGILRISNVLIVAQMDGWRNSDGLREEIEHFELQHKPIYDLDVATLFMTRRREKEAA